MDEEYLKEIHKLVDNIGLLHSNQPNFCFYCLKNFKFEEIKEFHGSYINGKWENNTTAICPKCGIDSVLPSLEINMVELIKEMNHYWFQHYYKADTSHWCRYKNCKYGLSYEGREPLK